MEDDAIIRRRTGPELRRRLKWNEGLTCTPPKH
jgi:hypothetical protein